MNAWFAPTTDGITMPRGDASKSPRIRRKRRRRVRRPRSIGSRKSMGGCGYVWARLRETFLILPNGRTFRFEKWMRDPTASEAQGPRVIENFLDVGHFPFVHAGFLGDPEHTEVGDYEVESDGGGHRGPGHRSVAARSGRHRAIGGGEIHLPGAAAVDCVLPEIA